MNVRKFIDRMGGAPDVADGLRALGHKDAPAYVVHQWSVRNTIPHKWRPPLAIVALNHGLGRKQIHPHCRPFLPVMEAA